MAFKHRPKGLKYKIVKENSGWFKKGHIISEELKLKLSKRPIWCKGKKFSTEHRKKLSKSHKGKVGEKSSNWRGGITSLDYRERRRFRRKLQKLIFERDNYTCQLCGIRGADLQVDHIQEWSKYVELRFDINNCRTLCAKCHYKLTFKREMPTDIKGWGHNLLKGGDYHSI